MTSKKNKNKSKSKSEKGASIETKVVPSEAIPYQAFKDLSSPDAIAPLKKIAIQTDNTLKETVLWKDIQRVFPNVLRVKNGDTDVPFSKNDNSEDLLPLRIPHFPGVVLGVVSEVSKRTEPIDIVMPALESLSLEIDIIKKPCPRDPRGRDREALTDAQRSQKEKEALKTVKTYSPLFGLIDFLSGTPLKALTTLAYSDKLVLQKTAALEFPANVVKGGGPVKREVMEPILYLLRSDEIAVHEPALYALAKLVYHDEKNCKLAVELGALEDLNRLMRAATPDVHWIALVVVYEIIQKESLKVKVAKSGVIDPLFPLALPEDARVPRIVAATFFEFSRTSETRQMIVEAGAIPVLICFLDSLHPDVQQASANALAEIALAYLHRRTLVDFLDPSSPNMAPVAATDLAKLAFDQDFSINNLQSRVLLPLFRMMSSNSIQLIDASMKFFIVLARDLSVGSMGVEARLIDRIVELVSHKGNDFHYHSVFALNVLAHNEQNARAIIEAGAVNRVCALVSQATLLVQSEMVKFLCRLTSFESLWHRLDRTGMFEALIPLSLSPKEEVWGTSAAAILQMNGTKNYLSIVRVWNTPTGGLRKCFIRSLRSNNGSYQFLAIHAIFEWLEDEDHTMKELIGGSPEIVACINELANDPKACAPVPMEQRRSTTGIDPSVITMVKAGSILEILALMRKE